MKYLATTVSALALATLAGCASHSDEIQASYVSPNEYASFSCDELEYEMRNISQNVAGLGGLIDEDADGDAWQMGVGLVLFWPALLFLEGGDGAKATEYASLKGKYTAVETQYHMKHCGVDSEPAQATY